MYQLRYQRTAFTNVFVIAPALALLVVGNVNEIGRLN